MSTIPNTALRLRPEGQAPPAPGPGKGNRSPVVWKIDGDKLAPVTLQTGLTDGIHTEVVSGDLNEGDAIAVPPVQANNSKPPATAPARSPFTGGRRR
jgi:HlyD family secretion protein